MAEFNNSYVVVLARTIDILLCGWVWRTYDLTISSMCGLELKKPLPARWARVLGWCLNHIQKNHCNQAIDADTLRAHTALLVLSGMQPP